MPFYSVRSLYSLFAGLRLSSRQVAHMLTLWPLVRDQPEPHPLRIRISTLAEALEDGFASVDEQITDPTIGGDRCSVSEVWIGNRARDALLIVDSEEFRGERGSLIADASVLLPPRSELAIGAHPVVAANDAEDLGRSFSRVENQVGFIAAVGDDVVGLEAMGDTEVFARSFATLLRPYTFDALDAALASRTSRIALDPPCDSPEPFLDALRNSSALARPTSGLGRNLLLRLRGWQGVPSRLARSFTLRRFLGKARGRHEFGLTLRY